MQAVKLQLQYVAQSQFAGYFVAREKGFYADRGLDVTIVEGGTEIVSPMVLGQGGADFATSWVPKALVAREHGALITNVAQVFQKSGTLLIAWADSGITKAGLDPAVDIEFVQQQSGMSALLNREIDVAEAMSYYEYAELLEARNPKTGERCTAADFIIIIIINDADEGVGMYQDAIWASQERLEDSDYQALAQKFVTASLAGWIYCRDNPQESAEIVTANGSNLGASHQLWMLNEVNKLIWPSPAGIGIVVPELWAQTVSVARGTKDAEGSAVITAEPAPESYTNAFAEAANAELTAAGLDTTGGAFVPITVTLNEGGN
jgi:NitT/TauT family transport system substrate-binding protein